MPPRFTTHHMPTSDSLVPDCLCDACSEVRRAWVGQEAERPKLAPTYPGRTPQDEAELSTHPEYEPGIPTFAEWKREQFSSFGDPLCPDCGVCYVVHGTDCQNCLARRISACPAVPVRKWTAVPLVCSHCRRELGSIMATTDGVLSVCCMGCEREGR